MTPSTGLLDGFVALDLTGQEGQLTGRLFRDLGMEVIKVEPPSGDPVRRVGPFAAGRIDDDASLRFAFLNGGKKSITLDYTTVDGRDLLLRLVEHADVLLESDRPHHLESLGLGYDALAARNRSLVVSSLTGFGSDGPHASYAAPDIVGVAMGGIMFISGDRDLAPVMPPDTQGYNFASVFDAFGVLLALFGRETTKQGQHVDVSIQEAIATQEHMIHEAAYEGVVIERNGSQHKHTTPANIFPCSDGHVYLFILSARDWARLLEIWSDHPAELDSEDLRPPARRRAKADLINPLVADFTRRYTKAQLTELLQTHGIPCLPVNSPADFVGQDQILERDFLGETSSETIGTYRSLRFPALFDDARPPLSGPPPWRGEHNAEIYGGWLGLSGSDLELLSSRGVI